MQAGTITTGETTGSIYRAQMFVCERRYIVCKTLADRAIQGFYVETNARITIIKMFVKGILLFIENTALVNGQHQQEDSNTYIQENIKRICQLHIKQPFSIVRRFKAFIFFIKPEKAMNDSLHLKAPDIDHRYYFNYYCQQHGYIHYRQVVIDSLKK